MFQRLSIAMFFIFASLCLTAPAQQSAPSLPAGAAQASPAAPPSGGSNLVVVRVSGEPITEKQVLSAIELLETRAALIKPEQKAQRNLLLFKDAVDNLVTMTALKNEAKRLNITVDPAKIDQQMQQVAKRYPSPEEFQKALAGQGLTEADARKSLEETFSVQQLLDLEVKEVPVTDEEARKFYDANLNRFAHPEQAHVAQIFLKSDPNSTPEQKAELKKKAEEIRAEIESGKIAFKDAVAKYSQDTPNAPKDGDVGFVSRSQIQIKPLEEAIFATIPGSMAPVVEGPQGYHLVKVIAIRAAGTQPFDEVKSTILQGLSQEGRRRASQKYMDDIRAKAVVETFMTAEEFDKRHPVQ